MIISVLRSRYTVQVEVDADTVLACPAEKSQDIPRLFFFRLSAHRGIIHGIYSLPADFRQERLAIPYLNGPERNG